MLRKIITGTLAAAAVSAGLICSAIGASATTVDDVAEAARAKGVPEEAIAAGYDKYYSDPDAYMEEDFDYAIDNMDDIINDMIRQGYITPTPEPTTAAVDDTPAVTTASGESGTSAQTTTTAEPAITVTDTSGNSVTRVSEQDFINMDYNTKVSYIQSFTPDQQQIIIDNLTPDEYKSLLKSLPVEQKADVVNGFADVAERMGMNITVDEITNDKVSLSLRGDDGELLSVVKTGDTVEDTGYNRRELYMAAGGLVIIAMAALIIAAIKNFRRTEDENEE